MESPEQYKEALADVQRRIGQNLLLFQHVELMLKFLLSRGSFSGTVSQLKQLMQERNERVGKQMMGELIKPLIKTHLTPLDHASMVPPEGEEVSISLNVTFHHTDEERAAFQRELEELVAERNDLVHHALSRFVLDSVAGCQAASAELRRQNERFMPMSDKLRRMVAVMTDMQKIVAQLPAHLLFPKPQ